jgi:DNA-binding response OmpR family regulator
VLTLTTASTVMDRVEGLGLGADDYLPKPFDFAELVARIRALARRPATAAHTWNIHPRGHGRAAIAAGGGEFVIDFADPGPSPAPVTTEVRAREDMHVAVESDHDVAGPFPANLQGSQRASR